MNQPLWLTLCELNNNSATLNGFFQKKKKETHDFPHINFLRYHPALSGRPPLNIFFIDKINTFESFRQNKKKKHVETVVSEAGKIGKLWLKKKKNDSQHKFYEIDNNVRSEGFDWPVRPIKFRVNINRDQIGIRWRGRFVSDA